MTTWRWVETRVVHAIHDRQLAEHGGAEGVRDQGAIESALARPQNLAVYGINLDAASIAAAYLFGIARNHGFADGNKRTAWITTRLFLANNGCSLAFDKVEAVRFVEAVAAGELGETQISEWLRERLRQP